MLFSQFLLNLMFYLRDVMQSFAERWVNVCICFYWYYSYQYYSFSPHSPWNLSPSLAVFVISYFKVVVNSFKFLVEIFDLHNKAQSLKSKKEKPLWCSTNGMSMMIKVIIFHIPSLAITMILLLNYLKKKNYCLFYFIAFVRFQNNYCHI